MELFTAFIRKAIADHCWIPAFPRSNALTISHLLYAYDVIVFSKGSPTSLQGIFRLLNQFSLVTGQQINLSKSQLIFSNSTSPNFKQYAYTFLYSPETTNDLLYLGCPIPFGRGKNKLFQYLITIIQKETDSWNGKKLSKAGKVTMIKYVLQSLPIHVMSCVKLPISIRENILLKSPNFYGVPIIMCTECIGFLGMIFAILRLK